MSHALCDLHDPLEKRRTYGFFDDFTSYTDTQDWTKLAADSGSSVAISSTSAKTANGYILLTTGGTDNNEAEIYLTNALLLIRSGKPIILEARILYAEANTSAANVAFGLCSATGANVLLDNGGGPAASFSGAMIFKVDGGTVWKTVSSVGSTQTISTSTKTAGGTTAQTLRIEICPVQNGSIAEVSYFVDGLPLYSNLATRTPQPIKDNLDYTSIAIAPPVLYVKAGSSSSELLFCDYVAVEALR